MQINRIMRRGASCAALLLFAFASSAQDKPIAYPAKGQSAAQQRQDDGECYVWSKQSTGIDPAVVASTPLQPAYSTQQQGSRNDGTVAKSTLIGAAGGAAIGGIAAGEAGKGAAIGALVGVSRGIKQKQQQEAEAARRAEQQRAAAMQQAQAERQQIMNTFYRAYGACMTGRGYSVG